MTVVAFSKEGRVAVNKDISPSISAIDLNIA